MENTNTQNLNHTPLVLPPEHKGAVRAIVPEKKAFFNAIVKKLNTKPTEGRPTMFTDENVTKLKIPLQMGSTIEEACRSAHISRNTFYRWMKQYPYFSDMVAEWQDNPFLKARATIYGALKDPDTAKWFMERKKKDEFSTRQEMVGKNGKDLLPILRKLESDDYGRYSTSAKALVGQVVENEPSLQDKNESGGDQDIQTELHSDEAHNREGNPQAQLDPQS
jgi:hypothetical protein